MVLIDYVYGVAPLLLPAWLFYGLLKDHPLWPVVKGWMLWLAQGQKFNQDISLGPPPPVSSQLWAYLVIGVMAFVLTNRLVPHIKQYTLRKGICGKDLGKRGTARADIPIPEALGIAPGTVFLVCLIICLVGYATSHPSKLLDVNSALLSICFMLFLGFTDDVLDWPWRYKLVLPTVASLPLLCCYNGSTSIVVPIPLRSFLVSETTSQLTIVGQLASYFIGIDVATHGMFVDLGIFYLVYMGLLAVFCTNAINIYAGINGLEAGQSYVIGCAIMVHNGVEISRHSLAQENHLFSVMILFIFVGATMGLLRHNWYPADVFVGDTYCYFAGMTFAVVGILGHFSKTLLLFFIPQVINFLWSVPQLFKIVPCPRHRLPGIDLKTGWMVPSTFPCESDQHAWLKFLYRLDDTATEIPNMTVINLTLVVFGPLQEKTLCLVLMGLQMACCAFGFFIRYYIAQFFFES